MLYVLYCVGSVLLCVEKVSGFLFFYHLCLHFCGPCLKSLESLLRAGHCLGNLQAHSPSPSPSPSPAGRTTRCLILPRLFPRSSSPQQRRQQVRSMVVYPTSPAAPRLLSLSPSSPLTRAARAAAPSPYQPAEQLPHSTPSAFSWGSPGRGRGVGLWGRDWRR